MASGNPPNPNQLIEIPREVAPGWKSRGYLPHFESPEKIQHVTFHLGDSLPREVVKRLRDEVCNLPLKKQTVELRKRMEAWVDAGHGSCLLQQPVIADLVQNTLHFHNNMRYRLFAWVIMPNHVHVLFQTMNGWPMATIVASWKKHTAMKIMAILRPDNAIKGALEKPVWHREYWDRFIRDEQHFHQVVEYIHQNPVKAGLVPTPDCWNWSSAKHANQEIGVPSKSPTQTPGTPIS